MKKILIILLFLIPIFTEAATFGNTSYGGTGGTGAENSAYMLIYTPASGGEVTKMSFGAYTAGSATFNVKAILWLSSTNAIITNGISNGITSGHNGSAFEDYTFAANPTVTTVEYLVGFVLSGISAGEGFKYDASAAGLGNQDNSPNSYATPETFVRLTDQSRLYSIYATYTPTASDTPTPTTVEIKGDFRINETSGEVKIQ